MNGITIGTSVSVYRNGDWEIEPFTIELCSEICLENSSIEKNDVRRIDISDFMMEEMSWVKEQTHYEYYTENYLFTVGRIGEDWLLVVYDTMQEDLVQLCSIIVQYIDQVQELVYLYSEQMVEI